MFRNAVVTLLLLASGSIVFATKADAQFGLSWDSLPPMTATGPSTVVGPHKQGTFFSYSTSVTDTDTCYLNSILLGVYADPQIGVSALFIRSIAPMMSTFARSGSSGSTVNYITSGTAKDVTIDTTFLDVYEGYNNNTDPNRIDLNATGFTVQVRVTVN